jgi:hypothetical protein
LKQLLALEHHGDDPAATATRYHYRYRYRYRFRSYHYTDPMLPLPPLLPRCNEPLLPVRLANATTTPSYCNYINKLETAITAISHWQQYWRFGSWHNHFLSHTQTPLNLLFTCYTYYTQSAWAITLLPSIIA